MNMREIVEDVLQDYSTEEVFLFSVRCAECGRVYTSRPVRFSKAGVAPASEGKRVVYRMLYDKEREIARQTAIREAAEVFNRCPICRRMVCNRCFLICEDLDMCRSCASRLNETGSPVMPSVVDSPE